jgi:hypothetical protein
MQTVAKLFILFTLVGAISCKKEEAQAPGPVTPAATDYMKLKPGNYWIYKEYRVTDTSEHDEKVTDSVYVEKDTIISNNLFHKLVRPSHWSHTPQLMFLRDSLGYTVDHLGKVHFAKHDFTTIFAQGFQTTSTDTIAKFTTKMTDMDFAVSTPAGVFVTSAFTTQYDIFPKYQVAGNEVIHYRTRYANGVGMVTEVLAVYVASPEVWERRLVRWHVQ